MFDALEYTKTHYFAEFERKRELNSSVSTPVALASAYAAAIVTMATSIRPPLDVIQVLVLLGSGLTLSPLALALYFLFRSYVGYAFCYVATPDQLLSWREEAKKMGWSGKALDDATATMAAREYASAAGVNAAANDRKSGFLHKANLTLGVALLCLVATAVPWVIEKVEVSPQDRQTPSSIKVSEYACGREARKSAEGEGAAAAAAAQPPDQGKRDPKRTAKAFIGSTARVPVCLQVDMN